ncbi:hypothetical protein LguiB_011230 [Lonicera macranthoides]
MIKLFHIILIKLVAGKGFRASNISLTASSRSSSVEVSCKAIETYGKCGDQMPQRDGGSWNAMIMAYTRHGHAKEALDLFLIHGLIVKLGLSGNVILGSSFVDVYGKCQVMSDTRRMFDEIDNPNAVSWNVIVGVILNWVMKRRQC